MLCVLGAIPDVVRKAVFDEILVFKLVSAYVNKIIVRTWPEAPWLVIEDHVLTPRAQSFLDLEALSLGKRSASEGDLVVAVLRQLAEKLQRCLCGRCSHVLRWYGGSIQWQLRTRPR